MVEKVTSLKIDPELWKKVKILAVRRGITLKGLIEGLLTNELQGEEASSGEIKVSEKLLGALEEKRRKGLNPFTVLSEKSAVELIREERDR